MKEAAGGPLGVLQALSKKMIGVQRIVSREIHKANQGIEASIESLKKRDKKNTVIAQNQTMTSFNELGVLLSDLLEQAETSGQQKAAGASMPFPSLSEWEQQLGEQIRALKERKAGGESYAQGLVEAIAQQEAIRRRWKK